MKKINQHLENKLTILFTTSLVTILLFVTPLSAKEKTKHRHHHAHEHGSAQLSIAFDGLKGRIELTSPADSIIGFEYVAKTAKDKETLMNAVKIFNDDFSKMVQIDSKLGCTFTVDSIEQKMESKSSKHSDFKANYNIVCLKNIIGSKIVFNFSKFDKLNDVDVTIIADQLQKNFEISNKEITVDLK